ncbi:MAG: hypothetical protein E6Q50_08340 [Lysobacter sp.]|nr:MAG: hypothetical protein E6Q50_08340 [Lysobacter sp.]
MSMQSFAPSLDGTASRTRRIPRPSASAFGRASVRSLALTLAVAAALSACGKKSEDAPKPDPAAAPPKVEAAVCQASASWIASPNPPSEVAAAESFCDFYQFSWQWFLAQVAPAPDFQNSGNRVFETNRLHDPSIDSGQCSQPKIMGRAMAAAKLALRVNKPQGFEQEQADGNALYDQHSNILRYNIWYSDAECQSTQQGFAAGTLEIKVSWKILTNPDPSYYSMQATLPGQSQPVTLGLVGFHIANWTSKHPEMIWATFEHKTNAPLCDGSSPMPANGWALASNEAAQCLTQNPVKPGEPPSTACAQFNFNTPDPFQGDPPQTNTPNNICRMFANGNQPGPSINGNDNAANLLAIQQLNTQLVGPQGLLTALPDTDPMAIWKNYELIGGIWTKGGANSGNAPVPNAGSQFPNGDPSSLQRGSLELTNTTMETFEQGSASQVPNCFGCHNFDTTDPLDVSHICTSLFGHAPNQPFTCVIPAANGAVDAKTVAEAAPAAAPAKP